MTTEPMTLPIRPAPLREVLDAGGNPRTILGDEDFEHLVRELIASMGGSSPEHVAYQAEFTDSLVEASCLGETRDYIADEAGVGYRAEPRGQAWVNRQAWRVDVLRDTALLDALLGFCTATERAAWEYDIDCRRSPYPLVVAPAELTPGHDRWLCEGCGSNYVEGVPCLRIGGRDGHSDAPEAGPWCESCVRDALREIEVLGG